MRVLRLLLLAAASAAVGLAALAAFAPGAEAAAGLCYGATPANTCGSGLLVKSDPRGDHGTPPASADILRVAAESDAATLTFWVKPDTATVPTAAEMPPGFPIEYAIRFQVQSGDCYIAWPAWDGAAWTGLDIFVSQSCAPPNGALALACCVVLLDTIEAEWVCNEAKFTMQRNDLWWGAAFPPPDGEGVEFIEMISGYDGFFYDEVHTLGNVQFGVHTLGAPSPTYAVRNLLANAASGRVDLSWLEPADGNPPTQYNIYRSGAAGGPWNLLTTVPYPTTTYSDTTVVDGNSYYYKVTATVCGVERGTSNIVSIQPLPGLAISAGGPYSAGVDAAVQLLGSATGGTPPFTWSWSVTGSTPAGMNYALPSPTLQKPVFTPMEEGTYNLRLEVRDSGNPVQVRAATTSVVSVYPPVSVGLTSTTNGPWMDRDPIAFVATPTGGKAPYTCDWYADGSPVILIDPADPCKATMKWPQEGTGYEVRVTARDSQDPADEDTASLLADILDHFQVRIEEGGGSGVMGGALKFTPYADGGLAPYHCTWSASPAAGVTPPPTALCQPVMIEWPKGGAFSITLTVTDDAGDTRTATGPVNIRPPSPPDQDGDGVPDPSDNCPLLANGNQADADADGKGDACDSLGGGPGPTGTGGGGTGTGGAGTGGGATGSSGGAPGGGSGAAGSDSGGATGSVSTKTPGGAAGTGGGRGGRGGGTASGALDEQAEACSLDCAVQRAAAPARARSVGGADDAWPAWAFGLAAAGVGAVGAGLGFLLAGFLLRRRERKDAQARAPEAPAATGAHAAAVQQR